MPFKHSEPASILLYGFKGVGKTYLGQRLAEKLGRPFYDLDRLLEAEHPLPVREIYRKWGEDTFRKLERECLRALPLKSAILALGGGTPLDAPPLQKISKWIYLKASFPTLQSRLKTLPAIASSWEELFALYQKRLPVYERHATLCLDIDTLTEDEILNQMVRYGR